MPHRLSKRKLLRHRVLLSVAMTALCALVGVFLWGAYARIRLTDNNKPAEYDRPNTPYISTDLPVVDAMLEIADIRESDLVYDLGCGDGRIVVQAAKRFGCRAIGFEIDPQAIADAHRKIQEEQVGDLVTVENRDIFSLDLSKADVINIYLLPHQVTKLVPQLQRTKPGCRIVCHDFGLEGFAYDRRKAIDGGGQAHVVFLYTAPLGAPDESFRTWSKSRVP